MRYAECAAARARSSSSKARDAIPVSYTHLIFATKYVTVNVGDLEAKFENEAVIDAEALKACGLIKKVCDGVKVLGNGEVTKNFTVKAAAFSASAKEKIEKAGGKAEVI